MTKKLIIIGAGDLGREIFHMFYDELKAKYTIAGFLDDDVARKIESYSVIGSPKDYQPQADEVFVCAIANTKIKLQFCQELSSKGAQFINLIHSSAIVNSTASLGDGCVIYPYACISNHAKLGNFILMNYFSVIGHDVVAQDGCTLHAYTNVTGKVTLGEGVSLGSHASILPGLTVGDYGSIGAGSVAVKSVAPHTTVFGVPAKRIF